MWDFCPTCRHAPCVCTPPQPTEVAAKEASPRGTLWASLSPLRRRTILAEIRDAAGVDPLLASKPSAHLSQADWAAVVDGLDVAEQEIARLCAERDALQARARAAERQLAAIDSLSEEAWEDGTAVDWSAKIRSGKPLDGLPTQEAYEARFAETKHVTREPTHAPVVGDDRVPAQPPRAVHPAAPFSFSVSIEDPPPNFDAMGRVDVQVHMEHGDECVEVGWLQMLPQQAKTFKARLEAAAQRVEALAMHADPEVVARLRHDRAVLAAHLNVISAEARLHGRPGKLTDEAHAILERDRREQEGRPVAPAGAGEGPVTAAELDHLDALRAAASPGRLRKGAVDKDRVFLPWEGALEGPNGERVLFRMNVGFPFEVDAAYLEAAWNQMSRLVRALREEQARAAAWRRYALAIVACERAHRDVDLDAHTRAAVERRRVHEELLRLDPEHAPPPPEGA